MIKQITAILVILCIALSGTVFAEIVDNTDDIYMTDQIIVRYAPDVMNNETSLSAMSDANSNIEATVMEDFSDMGVTGLQVIDPGVLSVEEAVDYYNNRPEVLYAEPDYLLTVNEESVIPNDSLFPILWGLKNTGQEINGVNGTIGADINATKAWEITTGSKDVVVAVLDTGVDYTHEDLAANMWVNPGEIPDNGIDDDNNNYVDDYHGWNFYNDDNDPIDNHGHGTHCAGTIGSVGNNGIGVTGVNWNVKIMPLKFLDNGSGPISGAISGILYADKMGADIISCSFGGGGDSNSLKDAINASKALVVCSAGNEGVNSDITPHYPSGYDCENIISVAATSNQDILSQTSNYGANSVDLGAPGVYIISTFPNNLYMGASGTSMAAPYVSGVAALILSQCPTLESVEVKERILDSVDKIDSLTGKCVTGGRLNAYEALLLGCTVPTPTPTSSPTVTPTTTPTSTPTTTPTVTPTPEISLKIYTSPADLLSSNSARLNGNIDTFGTGATRGVFWFEYGTQSGEYNKTSEMEIVGVKKFNFDLTGLEPDTKYYFRAGVTNNLKETAYGNELFFTTDPTPIEVSVKTDKADSITSSNATLFGTVNKFGITDNNGTVWFDYGKEDNNLANNTTPEFLVGSKPFNSTLAGLDVNTSYYFQAVAMNDLGQITTGDVLPFTTGKYSVETNADEFSSIYPLGPVYGDTGETLTFNIAPKAGSYLTDVLDNGTSVKGQMVNNSYSVTLNSNHNLTSISKLNPETLFVNFSVSDTTVGVLEEVHFYDDTNGYPTQWSWDFGDGGYSTVKDPSYKYTKSGNYSVTLWARGVSGAGQSIKSDYITVTSQ